MYGGVQFRSRLEAKWAAFFDAVGWRWSYEPVDLNGWTPDFVLHLNEPVYVEVKPALTEEELRENIPKIEAASPGREVLLLGADVGLIHDVGEFSCWEKDECNGPVVSLGLLGEPIRNAGGSSCLAWGAAVPFLCGSCDREQPGSEAFAHAFMNYTCRRCGKGAAHRQGYCFHWPRTVMRAAGNKTQWRRS
jgi:hypothetical protein